MNSHTGFGLISQLRQRWAGLGICEIAATIVICTQCKADLLFGLKIIYFVSFSNHELVNDWTFYQWKIKTVFVAELTSDVFSSWDKASIPKSCSNFIVSIILWATSSWCSPDNFLIRPRAIKWLINEIWGLESVSFDIKVSMWMGNWSDERIFSVKTGNQRSSSSW